MYDLLLHLGKRRRISLIRPTTRYYSTSFWSQILGVVDVEMLSPVPSACILHRAETMPDSKDVLLTVGRADEDAECVVSGIKIDPLWRLHG